MSAGIAERIEKLHLEHVEIAPLLDDLAAGDLARALGALQQSVNSLAEVQRRLVARVSASDVWGLDGFRSPAPWIGVHSGLPRHHAARLHRRATTMRALRHASDAALHGVLHEQHVDGIVGCARRAPDRFDDATDETFTAVAAAGDAAAFAAVVRDWHAKADAVDSPDPSDLEPVAAAESMTIGQTLDGRWYGQFALSEENGAQLNAALDRGIAGYVRARRDGDPSVEQLPIPALRAQALMDLVDGGTRRDPRRPAGPDRFHLALTLHADEHGHIRPVEPMPAGATCDAAVYRLVLGSEGQPLDIGRSSRTWPPALRTAIVRRDAHCRFPGCHAPPGHCDIHHCVPWEHGGATSLHNGVLLCRWHHTYLHRQRWTVDLNEHQEPTFRRPDGTEHALHPMRPGAP